MKKQTHNSWDLLTIIDNQNELIDLAEKKETEEAEAKRRWIEMSKDLKETHLETPFKVGDEVEILDGFNKGGKGTIRKMVNGRYLLHGGNNIAEWLENEEDLQLIQPKPKWKPEAVLNEIAKYSNFAGGWHNKDCHFIAYDKGICNCDVAKNNETLKAFLNNLNK